MHAKQLRYFDDAVRMAIANAMDGNALHEAGLLRVAIYTLPRGHPRIYLALIPPDAALAQRDMLRKLSIFDVGVNTAATQASARLYVW